MLNKLSCVFVYTLGEYVTLSCMDHKLFLRLPVNNNGYVGLSIGPVRSYSIFSIFKPWLDHNRAHGGVFIT